MSSWIVTTILALAGLVVWLVSRQRARDRRQAWATLAPTLGLQVADATDPFVAWMEERSPGEAVNVPDDRYPHPLLYKGRNWQAPNVMVGRYGGRRVCCFEYQHDVRRGSDVSTRYHLCLLLAAPCDFARLCVYPRTDVTRTTDHTGLASEVGADPFSCSFKVTCDDDAVARQLLTGETKALLVQHPWMCLEGYGPQVLFYHARTAPAELAGEVGRLLDFGRRFMDLLPAHLSTHGSVATAEGGRARA